MLENAQVGDSTNQTGTKSRRGCLIAFLILAIPYVLVSRTISPSDWVDVAVGPLPAGSKHFCLIAEDSQGIGTLPWYHAKVFPFTEDPFLTGSLGGGSRDFDNDGFIVASVQWRDARRYGVLVHRRDDQWRLWWLEPGDLQPPSVTRFVFGEGKAAMRLPAADLAEVPPPQLLQHLGLSREKSP